MTYSIGSFSLMKNLNIATILEKIQQNNGISRAQIAKDTGLTAATVTNITSELIESGVIIETKTGDSTGGRRPIILQMNPNKYAIASVYISPDKIEFMLLNLLSDDIYYNSIQYDKNESIEKCTDFIVNEYHFAKQKYKRNIIGVSIGMHGIVNTITGTSVFAPNLNWHNVELSKILSERIDAPIYIDNDVRLMTMGEVWFAAAKNTSEMVYLYIGNGIGSSIVINKEVYKGYSAAAGEIGHFTVDADGPECTCGNRGCLQSYANTHAIDQYIKDALSIAKRDNIQTVLNIDSNIDELVSAEINDDKIAHMVFEKEASYLSIAIGNIINMINPQMIVISSSVNKFSELIIPYIEKQLPKRSMKYQREVCLLKHSDLGKKAVLKGGAALVLTKVYEKPHMITNSSKN